MPAANVMVALMVDAPEMPTLPGPIVTAPVLVLNKPVAREKSMAPLPPNAVRLLPADK